ncbi:MAG: protein-tyrosine phosphatase family protein [Acidobacteriaceae bacterium]
MMAHWIETGIPAKLAIMPRPRGGKYLESEIRTLKREGAHVLVSLLTPEEEYELGLEHERAACSGLGLQFRNFPIPDREVPVSTEAFLRFLDTLHHDLLQRRSIVAHCFAGIGRSSLLLASLLRREGLSTDDAFRRITQARGMLVPDTAAQLRWVENLPLDL